MPLRDRRGSVCFLFGVPLPPLSEAGVRLRFRQVTAAKRSAAALISRSDGAAAPFAGCSRLESFIPPRREVLTAPRRCHGCRDFGEPVLCKTNTRLLGSKIAKEDGDEDGLEREMVRKEEIF